MEGACDTYGAFVVNSEVKEPFGRTICRCQHNTKISLNAIGWEGVYWIYLAQDRKNWRGSHERVDESSVSMNSQGISSLAEEL